MDGSIRASDLIDSSALIRSPPHNNHPGLAARVGVGVAYSSSSFPRTHAQCNASILQPLLCSWYVRGNHPRDARTQQPNPWYDYLPIRVVCVPIYRRTTVACCRSRLAHTATATPPSARRSGLASLIQPPRARSRLHITHAAIGRRAYARPRHPTSPWGHSIEPLRALLVVVASPRHPPFHPVTSSSTGQGIWH
jgi:hypothetical protein